MNHLLPLFSTLLIASLMTSAAFAADEVIVKYEVDQTKVMDFDSLSYKGNSYFPKNLTFKITKSADGKRVLTADYIKTLKISSCETFDQDDLTCREVVALMMAPSMLLMDVTTAFGAALSGAKPGPNFLLGDEATVTKRLIRFENTRPNRLIGVAYASLAQGAVIENKTATADCLKEAQLRNLDLRKCEVFVTISTEGFVPALQIRVSIADKKGNAFLSDNELQIISAERPTK